VIGPAPSASAFAGPQAEHAASKAPSSNPAAIAGGVLGALILLGLAAFVFVLMRRRKNRTAPSAEFLTVHPPRPPFERWVTFPSDDPSPSFRNDRPSVVDYP